MKQFKFMKSTGQGIVDGVIRILGKFIYFKYNDSTYAKQAVASYRSKGIKIEEGKGWVRVDILGENPVVKLGEYEIDQEEDPEYEIEDKLYNFYKEQFTIAGFFVKEE